MSLMHKNESFQSVEDESYYCLIIRVIYSINKISRQDFDYSWTIVKKSITGVLTHLLQSSIWKVIIL